MNENLYASPLPVEETFVPDEKWQRNARSLRVTAWGLCLGGVGFLIASAVMFVGNGTYMFGLYHRSVYWEYVMMAVGYGGMAAASVGGLLCLACSGKVVRFGRLLVLGLPAFFFLTLALMWFRSSRTEYQEFLLIVCLATSCAGLISWCTFLLRLGRSLGIRHSKGWIWLTLALWFAVCLLVLADAHWPLLYFRIPRPPISAHFWLSLALPAASGACGVGMLILGAGISRGFRTSQNTENHHE